MTNATFTVAFVESKTLEIGALTWTSTSADVRPTFALADVLNPEIGDVLHFFFDGVEYTETIDYEHLYLLRSPFPEVPELLNDTYEAYVRWYRGSDFVTSNTVTVTINVAYSVPVISGTPTISRTGDTFTVVPTSATGRPTPTRTYQWYRDASPISGETGTTYDYTSPDDEGTTISCSQIETNSEGSDTAASNGIDIPIDPWLPSTTQPANVNKAFSSSSHTFSGIDFVSGLGIVCVGQNTTGRTITGVTVGGNACTQVAVSGAVHYASMWKITIATPGNYDVVVTASAALGTVGILTGTMEGVNAAETDTATMDYTTASGPYVTSSEVTVPTDGIGLAFMCSKYGDPTTWSSPAELSKNTTTGSVDLTVSTARLFSSGTPTFTSHVSYGNAMVAAAWGP